MDARNKADFINSVAAVQTVLCPQCGTANESDSNFCYSCGCKLTVAVSNNAAETAAFKSVEEKLQQMQNDLTDIDDPVSAFAEGLPTWDIVPPQMLVRRRKTK